MRVNVLSHSSVTRKYAIVCIDILTFSLKCINFLALGVCAVCILSIVESCFVWVVSYGTVSAGEVCYVASSYYETLGSYLPTDGYVISLSLCLLSLSQSSYVASLSCTSLNCI